MDMMRSVTEGHVELGPLMWNLLYYKQCEQILAWLLRNKITGKKLLDWWTVSHEKSYLNLATYVIRKIEKDNEKLLSSRDLK